MKILWNDHKRIICNVAVVSYRLKWSCGDGLWFTLVSLWTYKGKEAERVYGEQEVYAHMVYG